LPVSFVQDTLVVNGASSPLDGNVRAEVEVELEGMSTTRLDQGTGKRVVVAISLSWPGKEADVVTLASNDDSELGKIRATQLHEALLHISNLFLKNSSVLTVMSLA
jgi:hypothetical protein